MTTKLQLTNEYGVITIETNENVDGCDNFINHLVRPILKAVGFLDATVDYYIGDFEAVTTPPYAVLSDLLKNHLRDDGGVTSSPDYAPDDPGFWTDDTAAFSSKVLKNPKKKKKSKSQQKRIKAQKGV